MPELVVVKTSIGEIRGITEEDDKKLRKYEKFQEKLEPGEFFTLVYKQPRNLVRHRRFFAMLKLGFDQWEPSAGRKRLKYKGHAIAKDFDQFRKNILILAGFYRPKYDLKGRVELQAESMSFDNMDDDRFEEMYVAVQNVLLEHVLTNYRREDVEHVLSELERF